MDKSFFIVMGLLVGLVGGLAVDMAFNRGDFAARHIHHAFPECANVCHN